jgi:cardiolipin synthase/putative cardiolipin synthase
MRDYQSSEDWYGEDADFTIARGLRDPEVLPVLRNYFAEQPERQIEVDRTKLNSSLSKEYRLSKSDAEALFTGLVLNGVANQKSGGQSFADYSFSVECEPASKVLELQCIGRRAIDETGVGVRDNDYQSVELTATFPPGIKVEGETGVRPLSSDLRKLFFGADSVVRIANPYFDPNPAIVGDIASLANRGVTTKILTRETRSASESLASAMNSIYEQIDPPKRHQLKVRDLFKRDENTGRQAYATHAKLAIADREICYLGSANLTDTSLQNNFELGVLLRGNDVDVAIDVFDSVFEFSRAVDLPL